MYNNSNCIIYSSNQTFQSKVCIARVYIFFFLKKYTCKLISKFFILCSFVTKILDYALEDSQSKSSLVYSLSVCISLLDPKRSAVSSPLFHSFRSQNMYEPPIPVSPHTIGAMLPKLGKYSHVGKSLNAQYIMIFHLVILCA